MKIKNLSDLKTFAREFSEKLNLYDVIVLDGDLGAGKTQLVKYLCHYLNIQEEITSPTFPIVNTYEGKYKIYHMDLYRLETNDELTNIGFNEYLNDEAIFFIEWGCKFKSLMPSDSTYISISILNDNTRELTIIEN